VSGCLVADLWIGDGVEAGMMGEWAEEALDEETEVVRLRRLLPWES
jgi:hypothetical protein